MSKPRDAWWGYVRKMIYKYPRIGENATGVEAREREAVRLAIEHTERMQDAESRLKVVELVFWERRKNLDGAALHVHCSYETAKSWQQQFIREVARNFKCDGLLPKV